MAIKAGMTIAQAIGQLTKGFIKVMKRKPEALEKIKIQQEAAQKVRDLNKVVDMEGKVIDTSKGIMGGREIKAVGGRIGYFGGGAGKYQMDLPFGEPLFTMVMNKKLYGIYQNKDGSRLSVPLGSDGKPSYAEGGRIGLKDGPDVPGRRKFMKIMGGLATIPFVGKYFKQADKVAPAVEKAAEVVGQAPSYFFDLVTKIKTLGRMSDGPADRVKVYSMKGKDGKSELMLTEDISTGEMQIKKIGKENDEMVTDVQTMDYTPGSSLADETTKGIPADQYDEYTEFQSRIYKDEFNEPDIIEGINVEDIVKEVKDQAQSIKKAGGGIAMMLGE
jgi:hypothetical protein